VIKTDGLAAGKGVLVTADFEEASNDVREKLSVARSWCRSHVVIEEGPRRAGVFLDGAL